MQGMKRKTVGILGGIGPLSTVYFMEMIIQMTKAETDQEHIDMIVLNHAGIPDRTRFILGLSDENPLDVMVADARKLERAGADFIVIPCNTAHYFFDKIRQSVRVPILNIVEETVDYAVKTVPGLTSLGVLATDGTIESKTYQRFCEARGIRCEVPDAEGRAVNMRIIYDQVKAGKPADIGAFLGLVESLKQRPCEAVVLGCTELSVVKRDHRLKRPDIIDSLEVLAESTIFACGKQLKTETETA